MLRTFVGVFVITSLTVFTASAQGLAQPASLALDGVPPLPLTAQATRSHMLGLLDLYSVAMYVEPPRLDHAHLLSPSVPKAIRIVIEYEEDLRRPVWNDWRLELIPRLNAAGATHLRGAFASLRDGDVVLIEYVPEKGTTVRVNKAVGTSGASHELMLAYLDHWLGQRPVSEEMKRTLLHQGEEAQRNPVAARR
jgi:hypothetical protein